MTKDLGLPVKPTTALQDILRKRIARGDKVKDGLIRRKGK
jgi:hypothetical protein